MAGTPALVAMLTRHQEPLAIGHFLWWAEVEELLEEGEDQVVVDPFQDVGVELYQGVGAEGVQNQCWVGMGVGIGVIATLFWTLLEGMGVGIGVVAALFRQPQEGLGLAVVQLGVTLQEKKELALFLAWQPVPACDLAFQLEPVKYIIEVYSRSY